MNWQFKRVQEERLTCPSLQMLSNKLRLTAT
jgi:hypothetical protein